MVLLPTPYCEYDVAEALEYSRVLGEAELLGFATQLLSVPKALTVCQLV